MGSVTWVVLRDTKQAASTGHVAIKYRMAPGYTPWLLYAPGESLDGGDYKAFDTLREMKLEVEQNA